MARQTTFGKYLTRKGISQIDAAAQLGITKQYVWGLASGQFTPGLKMAAAIERWSKGAVKMQEWT